MAISRLIRPALFIVSGLFISTISSIAGTPVASTDYLNGYIFDNLNYYPNYGGGYSYYVNVANYGYPQVQSAQYGQGTWLVPDNHSATSPICPYGTPYYGNPNYSGNNDQTIYQTIEGGVGQWYNTRFPSMKQKYRINGTGDCYASQYGQGYLADGPVAPLGPYLQGLAQLSNRLLMPQDGYTMAGSSQQALLGVGWLSLPIIPANSSPLGFPTGGQTWTIFFNTTNFTGPAAFVVPSVYSAVQRFNPALVGTGLDSKPAWSGAIDLEVGSVPLYASTDANGVAYRRAAPVSFGGTDANGHLVLIQDLALYNSSAIAAGFSTWMNGGAAPTSFVSGQSTYPQSSGTGIGFSIYSQNGTATSVVPDQIITGDASPMPSGSVGIGITAKTLNALGQAGLPEYFKLQGGNWVAIPASQVPAETGLQSVTFPLQKRSTASALPVASPATASLWAAGPFSATLNDGSIVDYVWYRFIDQPAIKQLPLSDSARNNLQTFVTNLHKSWGTNGVTIPAPSAGATLASFDPALLVTPPAGLAAGYVPIVINQR